MFHADETRKTLKEGAIPNLMLPKKSISNPHTSTDRSNDQIAKRDIAKVAESLKPSSSCSKDFPEFIKRTKALQLGVSIKESENACQIVKHDSTHAIPEYEITVDSSLNYSIRAFCWQLPNDNILIKSHEGSMQNVTLSKLCLSKYEIFGKHRFIQLSEYVNKTEILTFPLLLPNVPTVHVPGLKIEGTLHRIA